jgi:hypothetical protein
MFLPERWRNEKKIEAEVLKMYSEIPRKDIGAIKFQYYNLMRTLKRYADPLLAFLILKFWCCLLPSEVGLPGRR